MAEQHREASPGVYTRLDDSLPLGPEDCWEGAAETVGSLLEAEVDCEAVDLVLDTAHHKPGSWTGMVVAGEENGIHGGHVRDRFVGGRRTVGVVLAHERMLLLQHRKSAEELGYMPVVVAGVIGAVVGMFGVVVVSGIERIGRHPG